MDSSRLFGVTSPSSLSSILELLESKEGKIDVFFREAGAVDVDGTSEGK